MVRMRKSIYESGEAIPVGDGYLYGLDSYKYRYQDGQFQILFDRKYHNANPEQFEFLD